MELQEKSSQSVRKMMGDSEETVEEDTVLPSGSGQVDDIARPTLMELLVKRDLEGFRSALAHATEEQINARFDRACTCLEYASEHGMVDFVLSLLEKGVDPWQYNTTRYGNAIVFAFREGQYKVLKCFLDPDIEIDCGGNELHLMVKIGVVESKKSMDTTHVLGTLDSLLEDTKIDLDKKDRTGATPIYLAAVGGWWEGVKSILYYGPDLDVEVDGRTARDVLEDDCPDLLVFPKTKGSVEPRWKYLKKRMFMALYNQNTASFVRMVRQASDLDAYEDWYTFLQFSCMYGLYDCVTALVENGAKHNQTCPNTPVPPVAMAAKYGYHRILKTLIVYGADIPNSRGYKKRTVLHLIALQESPYVNKEKDYHQCLEEVMSNPPEIDAKDALGNTALYYAAWNGDNKTIKTLLHAGASLGAKNSLGETPLSKIPPDTVQEFLDECIVEPDKAPLWDQLKITFQYKFLQRRRSPSPGSILDPEKQDSEKHDSNLSETTELWYLWQSSKHQHLLKHPVLSSFLHLKFQCIEGIYYFHLLVHTIFVLLLTYYLHMSFATAEPGSQSSRYAITLVNATFFTFIVLRELIQMSVSLKRYMISIENICESALIVLTILVVYCPIEIETKRHLAPFLMLLAWCEVLFILGQHPSLSTYMTMFATVSISYIKFLATFSLLICAFALSFSLVFYKCEKASDCDAFHYFPTSVLRTCVMMTGEFEFGSLPFSALTGTSQLIFFLFFFLVVIVLLNLLNGLAVSDTQAILDRAELVGCGSRLQLISYIECTALGETMPFSSGWGPYEWIRHLPDCSLYSVFHKLPKLRRIIRNVMFGPTVLLFRRLPKMQLKLTFSDVIKVRPERFYLDKSVAEAAKSVVLERKRRAKANGGSRDIQERLDALEKNMTTNMSDLNTKLNALISAIEARNRY